MQRYLYKLCDDRKVTVPANEWQEFITVLKKNNIYPVIEYSSNGSVLLSLPDPINKEEGRVIADVHHLAGDYDRFMEQNLNPFMALSHMGLI